MSKLTDRAFKQVLRDGSPSQISILADYIMAEIPGEPSQSEGAGEAAVRLLKKYRAVIQNAMYELGVPTDRYPAGVANAYRILEEALRTEW